MASRKTPAAERRAFERVPHPARAVLSTGRGEVAANVVDLSVGGLGLETVDPLARGEFVRVRLPLGAGDEAVWVDPDALVVRVERNPATGKTTVGLSFYDLPRGTLRQLSERVRAARLSPQPQPQPAPSIAPELAEQRRALRESLRSSPAEPTRPPIPERPKASGFIAVLANLFRRRADPSPRGGSGSTPPASTPSTRRGELRDLFRSALEEVADDERADKASEKAKRSPPPKKRP